MTDNRANYVHRDSSDLFNETNEKNIRCLTRLNLQSMTMDMDSGNQLTS